MLASSIRTATKREVDPARRDAFRFAGCLCCALLAGPLPAFAADRPPGALRLPREIAGVRIPDSPAAREAAELAYAQSPHFLFNHSMRVFVFDSLHSRSEGWIWDEEVAFVAAALHDLGLVPVYDSPTKTFEVAGADVARALAAENGFDVSRAERVWEAVSFHTNPRKAGNRLDKVGMTHIGAGIDVGFICRRPAPTKQVLTGFPRLGFNEKFREALRGYAKGRVRPVGEGDWITGYLAGEAPPCWPE